MTEIDLEALAAKVEALDGPCRETDLAIARIQRAICLRRNEDGTANEEFTHWRYTASIDAAMSLVPEGMDWIIDNFDGPVGRRCSASINSPVKGWSECHAATPALALTAAALKARATLSRLSPPNEVNQ